jgi:5,10-methylene-tetrahydrofolate dehydrogenase/methenyl tetrahydrofolate cyclohydrolase
MVKDGAVVIDVGMNPVDGNSTARRGFGRRQGKATFITTVPARGRMTSPCE